MKINKDLVELLRERKLKISTAESVTGGKIISSLIEISGASQITEKSFVVYSNKAKEDILGIDPKLISTFGVVSEEVALAMARKTKEITKSDIIVTTTGEAGPQLNDESILVGTVCYCLIIGDDEYITTLNFSGDRLGIINSSVDYVLNDLFFKLKWLLLIN